MSLRVHDIFNVSGKNVVVTGGSRGIGFMIARGFITNGANVFISARKKNQCDEAEKKLNDLGPGKCVAFSVDLSTDEGCKALVENISKHTDTIHVLVNNAGATWAEKIEKFPVVAWKKVMAINVESPFYLTRALLPHFKKAVSPSHRAVVINISSIAGEAESDGRGLYSYQASKAAINQLTRVLAGDLSGRGINVNAICPGVFPSHMTRDVFQTPGGGEAVAAVTPTGRVGIPSDIAGLALYMASPAGQFMTGALIPLDGGYLIKARL